MYIYQSPIGLMKIYYDRDIARFALVINETCYGHYDSAGAAASDVYAHVTGCDDWDFLDGEVLDAPDAIREWEHIK